MALTAQEIQALASSSGGGFTVFDKVNSGELTMDQVKAALGASTVDSWLATNKPATTTPTTTTPTTTTPTTNTPTTTTPTTTTPTTSIPTTGGATVGTTTGPVSNLITGPKDPTPSPPPTMPIIPRQQSTGVNIPGQVYVDNYTLLDEAARGLVSVPGADLQAAPVSLEGTITGPNSVQQLVPATKVTGGQVASPSTITANTVAQASESAAATAIDTATMQATNVGQAAPTQAANGQVSDGAVANVDFNPNAGTQSQAATVQIDPNATVEAAVGTMAPEALAEAAKIAGVETARINAAKNQLRKAGLTDEQIAEFGNDPSALEMKLGDFSDEQRGIIEGLPVEALMSTQMEQLLAGIQNGDVPVWAKPAVTAVESMLARRGLRASSIGRDSLANAIIQAAMPIAQSNAESIKQSVMQQREIGAQAAIAQAQMDTQVKMQNAQNVFGLNMQNLSNEQQARVINSQFFQTVALTEANNRQQTAIQNAVNLTNLDVAQLDSATRLAVENAKSFLQMDLTNLSNDQQAILIDSQFNQQKMLSDASAQNAAKQFNAASENQTKQFMANLATQISQFNASQVNSIKMFNATEANKIAAQNSGNEIAVQQFNAQMSSEIQKFNSQLEAQREQWNASNAQAIEQSNVQWRRQANTANTAAQNAINQQNVQNAFGLTAQAQAAMWQELRDAATFAFQGYENKEDREAQLYAAAIGNEAAAERSYDQTTHLVNLAKSFFGG